jgi:hypothetical protein
MLCFHREEIRECYILDVLLLRGQLFEKDDSAENKRTTYG